MQISEEQIDKYISIYFEEYGRSIDRSKALTELTLLVCLLESVYKFNNKKNYE